MNEVEYQRMLQRIGLQEQQLEMGDGTSQAITNNDGLEGYDAGIEQDLQNMYVYHNQQDPPEIANSATHDSSQQRPPLSQLKPFVRAGTRSSAPANMITAQNFLSPRTLNRSQTKALKE